jgi:hypothetical protein
MLLLVDLVRSSAQCTAHTARDGGIGSVSLGLFLVGFLAGGSTGTGDALGDVVGGVLDRVDGLADDALLSVSCGVDTIAERCIPHLACQRLVQTC